MLLKINNNSTRNRYTRQQDLPSITIKKKLPRDFSGV
jgi:hypothetical protein